MKVKAFADSDISKLFNQMCKLNETISQLHSTNEKIGSELVVVKNVNFKLEENDHQFGKKSSQFQAVQS